MGNPNDHSDVDMDDINASLHLEGRALPGGWLVGPRNDALRSAGAFSISYTVTHETGRQGFLKALDLTAVFGDLEELSIALNDYLAERDLLLLCGEHRMSRVVMALDHGQLTLEEFMPPLSTVHYIIFELAAGDFNTVLSEAGITDVAVRLDLLHDLAVGLRQLHSRQVAHQDLKPSNTLVFQGESGGRDAGKIADLGRAFRFGANTPHDGALVPGDRSFAPPEQLYGFEHPDTSVRRFGADLYQLGSLICYAFGAVTMNGLLAAQLDPAHHWERFTDGYREALPYLQDAYAHVIDRLKTTLPEPVADEVTKLIEYLCDPEAERRGHPSAHRTHGSHYSLERVVADLNLAAVRAGIRKRRAT